MQCVRDWLLPVLGALLIVAALVYAAASWDPAVCARVPGCPFVVQHIEGPVARRVGR